MQQLFDQIHKLPQVPEVVRTLINQLNDSNASFMDVAQNVEKEQVIALKILRLVNSAHFGLSRKVGSIKDATTILGMNQLKTLVIASGLVCAMPKLENFDIKQFWNDSFLSAAYAKWFAEQANLSADVAYTAGLLCNLGSLLIHIGMPSEANEIDQHFNAGNHTRSEIEYNRLGFNSQMVCAELCRRWKFASELIETIEQSTAPMATSPSSNLACCVFLGRYISDSLRQGKNETEIKESFPLQEAAQIGLSAAAIADTLSEVLAIESNLQGLAD
jgi:HD-like signal output (HDOD) protein